MKKSKRSRPAPLRIEELEPRLVPSSVTGTEQTFDTTAPGTLPSGWSQWSSSGTNQFAVSSSQSLSPPNALAVNSSSSIRLNGRAWVDAAQPANEEVSASIYLNSLIPVEIFDRGSNLNSMTPSFYAVSVTRGLDLQLLKVDNGSVTSLGEVKSTNWIDNQWVSVTLLTSGNDPRAQVRNAQGEYLNNSGQWQRGEAWALNVTDSSLNSGGEVGVGGASNYAGTVYVDNFSYVPKTISTQPPTVTINTPSAAASVSGVMPVQVTATDPVGVTSVAFYVDNVLRAVDTAAPYTWNFDTTEIANGTHTLTVAAYDSDQNVGQTSLTFTTRNNLSPLPRPTLPQGNSSVQLANLAYSAGATQLPPADVSLLQNSSVDMVVSDQSYLSQIHAIAPNTPQLIYSNVSNIYQSSLLSWLNYAEAHGISPEQAFYHVSQPTPFAGGGGSTQPVNWFWGVYTGGSSLSDRTWWAHAGSATYGSGVAFGGVGQAVYIGYPDQFWQINVNLRSGASGGWSGVLQYPTAVNASGSPTAWATLNTLGNTTSGLTKSGQITFNPPTDWKPVSIDGSAPMYYVRILTTSAGTGPVANTILGDDYTNSNGGTSGVIPAYDWALDTKGSGYLDPQQYAIASAAGYTARFAYQSRLLDYGSMRFVTNPGDAAFRAWAAGYETQYLDSNPLAAGLFMDNSGGNSPSASSVIEPVSSYATDYATLLYEIGRAIAPKWILANTAGGGSNANPTVQKVQGYFEEFAIRPLSANYRQFENLAALVATRSTLAAPPPLAVLDSSPQGGSPTDPRTELAALAYYYLLSAPNTFLDYNGGYDPSGAWSNHWFPAMKANIGQPTGSWSLFASGIDPSNSSLTYQIYQRSFTNGLVLYKPLSYGNGVSGTTANATATTEALGGTYYPLQADGTLGAPITSITLRNGEGAILIKDSAVASSFAVKTSTSSTTAGTAVQVTVEAVDSSGQIVPSYMGTVHFTSSEGSAVLPADYTFTAADKGVHAFSVTFKTAGSPTLTVSDPYSGISGTLSGFTVNPAAASQLLVVAPASVTVLTPLTLKVIALDPYGNKVANYTGTVHFTSSDVLDWLPADYTFTNADEGQHTFRSGLIMWQTGTSTITVTDTKTGIVGSTMIQVKKSSNGAGTDWIFSS
ncbi:MAG: Ig-like domain-containing protein [Gemmataceae bacterium]